MHARPRLRGTSLRSSRWLGPSALLGLALLLGRFSGVVREALLANRFGVSADADTAVLLLSLPDLMVNLLLAGGLAAALVPRFRSMDEDQQPALLRTTMLAAALPFTLLGLTLLVSPGLLFGVLAPGLRNAGAVSSAILSLIAITLPAAALSGVVAAYLNAQGRYFLVGCGTLIVNAAIIFSLLPFWRMPDALLLLAVGIAAGGVLRLASQMAIVPRRAILGKSLAPIDSVLARNFGLGLLSTSLTVAVPFALRAAASFLATGAIATFNYAQKLVELPMGILLTAIGTVALTRLSGHVAAGDHETARTDAEAAARLAFGLALLVTLFGILLLGPSVRLVLGGGAMSPADLDRVTRVTSIGLLAVPFATLANVATALLTARGELPTVVRNTFVAIAAFLAVAATGVALRSELALMAASVVFQATLAWLLVSKSEMRIFGVGGIAQPRVLLVALVIFSLLLGLAYLGTVGLPDLVFVSVGAIGVAMSALMVYALRK